MCICTQHNPKIVFGHRVRLEPLLYHASQPQLAQCCPPDVCQTYEWEKRPTASWSAMQRHRLEFTSSTFDFFCLRFELLCFTSINNSLGHAHSKWQNSHTLQREQCWSTSFFFSWLCRDFLSGSARALGIYRLICQSMSRLLMGMQGISYYDALKGFGPCLWSRVMPPLDASHCNSAMLSFFCSSHNFVWISKCSSSARLGLLVLVSWIK